MQVAVGGIVGILLYSGLQSLRIIVPRLAACRWSAVLALLVIADARPRGSYNLDMFDKMARLVYGSSLQNFT